MKKMTLHIILLVLVSAVFFFLNLGSVALMEPDEGRNAEVAREVLATGDWLTPHLDFIRYLDKPIFFFWAAAGSMKLMGVNEFAARFPSALSALIGVLAIYFLGRRMFGDRAGLLSGVVLASSPLYYGLGRIVIFDMMLTAFITLTMLFFLLGFTEQEGRRKRLFYLLSWAAMALAVLTKGPIGAVFPLGIIGIFLLLTGDLGRIREMELVRGPLVFLALAAPWYILVSIKNPEYPYYFFISEHLLRYTTTKFHRVRPFWYYVPVLVVGLLPWIFFLPSAFVHFLRRKWKQPDGETVNLLFPVIWTAIVFLFFSFSKAKMPAYILPLFPAAALLMGKYWDDYLSGRVNRASVAVPLTLLLIVVLLFGLGILASDSFIRLARKFIGSFWTPEMHALLERIGIASLVFAALSASLMTFLRKGRTVHFIIPGVLSVLLFIAGLNGLDLDEHLRSSQEVASRVLAERRAGDPVLAYEHFPSSLPFYLHEQVPVVSDSPTTMGSNFIKDYNLNYQGAAGPSIMGRKEFRAFLADRNRRVYILTKEEGGRKMQGEIAASFGRIELMMEHGKTSLWVRKESR